MMAINTYTPHVYMSMYYVVTLVGGEVGLLCTFRLGIKRGKMKPHSEDDDDVVGSR